MNPPSDANTIKSCQTPRGDISNRGNGHDGPLWLCMAPSPQTGRFDRPFIRQWSNIECAHHQMDTFIDREVEIRRPLLLSYEIAACEVLNLHG